MPNPILSATPGAVIASAPECHDSAGDVMTRPAGPTITTSTRSFEARPYRPSCSVHGCPEVGGWIMGSFGFRKLGDEKCIGLFCGGHMTERIAALDPMRFGGAA